MIRRLEVNGGAAATLLGMTAIICGTVLGERYMGYLETVTLTGDRPEKKEKRRPRIPSEDDED